jgi:hypothetical protein
LGCEGDEYWIAIFIPSFGQSIKFPKLQLASYERVEIVEINKEVSTCQVYFSKMNTTSEDYVPIRIL